MKQLFVSMSVKQNLFVSVFVHKCLMILNDVEYTTFKMFVTQMRNYLFVISFQLMLYKTLRYHLARALPVKISESCISSIQFYVGSKICHNINTTVFFFNQGQLSRRNKLAKPPEGD